MFLCIISQRTANRKPLHSKGSLPRYGVFLILNLKMEVVHLKKVIGVVVACLVVFTLVSCSGLKKEEIVGTYDLISIAAGGVNYDEAQLDSLRILGQEATLEIRDDNTATMNLVGSKNEMTYNASTGIFVLKGQNVKATFENGVLTLKDNSGTMSFRKR